MLSSAVVDSLVADLQADPAITVPQLARRHDVSVSTVRRYLTQRGVQVVDGRAAGRQRSAAATARTADADFVSTAARLYTAGRSIAEVASELRTGGRQVTAALHQARVTIRPAVAREARDHSADLKRRMAQAGITAADVRTWARRHDVDVPSVGIPPAVAVDAYLAHLRQAAS